METERIVSRKGSLVTLRDKKGKLWLTRREKKKKDPNRRKLTDGWSVRHIPIRRIIERGDWLFTCSMKPEQFGAWRNGEEDDFNTLNGSDHSKRHCSLSPISDEYAKFFNDHKLWELYDIYQDFDKYREAVKQVCLAYKIRYEGI